MLNHVIVLAARVLTFVQSVPLAAVLALQTIFQGY